MLADDQLFQIAAAHHHLVDRAQVGSVMTSRQWCRRVDRGEWLPVAPGVWRHRSTPVDWRLEARAGLRALGPRAALYGATAAAWWGLGEIVVADVEFVGPRSRRSLTFPYVVHTTRHWSRRDVLVHDGVRVTSASRTIVDLAAGRLAAAAIERVIDDACRRRLTSVPTLRARLAALGGPGRSGTTLLRALLLDSGGESYLERRFLRLLRAAGLPRPACQVVHRSGGRTAARVDFQFPGTKLIVEVSGRLGHTSDRDRQRDARRRNALQQAGCVVLEFTTADVLDGEAYVVATVAAELARSGHMPTTVPVVAA